MTVAWEDFWSSPQRKTDPKSVAEHSIQRLMSSSRVQKTTKASCENCNLKFSWLRQHNNCTHCGRSMCSECLIKVRSFTQKMFTKVSATAAGMLDLCKECTDSHKIRLHSDMIIPGSLRVDLKLADKFHSITSSGLKIDFFDAMNVMKVTLKTFANCRYEVLMCCVLCSPLFDESRCQLLPHE
jgi:hypothetical protein